MGDNSLRQVQEREITRLRDHLDEWFGSEVRELENDESWAETVLNRLEQRGFVYIEKCENREVLSFLGRRGTVHVARAPSRPLAVARVIERFAGNPDERILLVDE